MTRQILMGELNALLPWVIRFGALGIYTVLTSVVVWSVAYRRGIRNSPGAHRDEVIQERHKRMVAEERVDTWKKVAKQYESSLFHLVENAQQQATATREPPLRLERAKP